MTTITMTIPRYINSRLDPMCDCGAPLSQHSERWGCEPHDDINGEPCFCWQFTPAEPGDVRDDDGMGVPA